MDAFIWEWSICLPAVWGDAPSLGLSDSLRELGFELGRFEDWDNSEDIAFEH